MTKLWIGRTGHGGRLRDSSAFPLCLPVASNWLLGIQTLNEPCPHFVHISKSRGVVHYLPTGIISLVVCLFATLAGRAGKHSFRIVGASPRLHASARLQSVTYASTSLSSSAASSEDVSSAMSTNEDVSSAVSTKECAMPLEIGSGEQVYVLPLS